jgi:penicillin-insensitive murein endopeptidase
MSSLIPAVLILLAAGANAQELDRWEMLRWPTSKFEPTVVQPPPAEPIGFPESVPENPWRRVGIPAPGKAESIGFYSAGCLRGASELTEDIGILLMRPSRRRMFGHPDLLGFVTGLSARAAGAGLGKLLVGDVAQPRGGPTLSGHASHQTGLDVDIWFQTLPSGSTLTPEQKESMSAPNMVVPDFERLDPQSWRPQTIDLLRLAAKSPRIDRIFVNPVIKREACRLHRGEAWLGRLRPWWGHDDHFHARLNCPDGDKACRTEEDPVPPGDGCDATLDYWFTREMKERARRERTEPPPTPRMPVLPGACAKVLSD